jgi:hypothetical protein
MDTTSLFQVITARHLVDLIQEANLLISKGYTPLGGVTSVTTEESLDYGCNLHVDYNSTRNYMKITFMQTFYKPQIKDL